MADRHVEEYSSGADFAWVTDVLSKRRDEILERWLDAAAAQSFHAGRREHAVADHIPHLFDALLGLLKTTGPSWIESRAPLEDIGILSAAQSHARVRAEQRLNPASIVVEFRLLRQEIWRSLREVLPDQSPTGDVVAAEMLVNDALDSAITQGLAALSDYVEQVREEFLATTLHDLRQPLTSLSGEAQLLIRWLGQPVPPDPQRVRAVAERVQAATRRMMTMLETLSDMSRVALGSLNLQVREVRLEDVVRKALANCPPDEVGRTVLTVNPEDRLSGEWDPVRMEQVVSNLLGNSYKYSEQGTPVEVTLWEDKSDDTVGLIVRDYGIGIPADHLKQVFARYERASNAVEKGVDGQGLGLYLCKGIIEAHDGQIWAESAGFGQGTTINITLPRSSAR